MICSQILTISTTEKTLTECYRNTIAKNSTRFKSEFGEFFKGGRHNGIDK